MSWPFAFDSRKWSWTKLFFFRFSLTFLYLLYISFIVVSSNLRNGFILMMVGSSQSQTLQFHIDSMQRPLIFTHNFSKHWISNSEKITNDLSPQLAMVPTLISFCCKIIHIKKKFLQSHKFACFFFDSDSIVIYPRVRYRQNWARNYADGWNIGNFHFMILRLSQFREKKKVKKNTTKKAKQNEFEFTSMMQRRRLKWKQFLYAHPHSNKMHKYLFFCIESWESSESSNSPPQPHVHA